MLIVYFKQAWHTIRQNKLFSAVYIGGTALALSFTMLYGMIFYVKLAPFYPEYERNRTAYIETAVLTSKDSYDNWHQANLSLNFVRTWFYNLKMADKVSAQYNEYSGGKTKDVDGQNISVALKLTDPTFFEIYRLDFTDGKPFSRADFDSGVKVAVISSALAKKVFGADAANAVGKTLSVNFIDYRIVGVFSPGSAIHKKSYGEVIIPYTAVSDSNKDREVLGNYELVITTDNIDALKAEVQEIQRRYNSTHADEDLHLFDQPDLHVVSNLKGGPTKMGFDIWDMVLGILPALLGLLLIPAMNLSGMIAGRMEMRQPELGLRKSFGATRIQLLNQILCENLLLTLIGGFIALVITWGFIAGMADWIFGSMLSFYRVSATGANITADMLFSPGAFVIMFLICMLLNVMSALIPAWNSLRRPIIKSLKDNA